MLYYTGVWHTDFKIQYDKRDIKLHYTIVCVCNGIVWNIFTPVCHIMSQNNHAKIIYYSSLLEKKVAVERNPLMIYNNEWICRGVFFSYLTISYRMSDYKHYFLLYNMYFITELWKKWFTINFIKFALIYFLFCLWVQRPLSKVR